MPAVTSTPTVNESVTNASKSVFEPEDPSVVDNEVLYIVPLSLKFLSLKL